MAANNIHSIWKFRNNINILFMLCCFCLALPAGAQNDRAVWIMASEPNGPLPVLFHKFNIDKAVSKATITIAAPGYFEAWLNTQRIGNDVLHPAQTNYDDYTLSAQYSITKLLQPGSNQIKVYLGKGWWNQDSVWHKGMNYGSPVLWANITITFTDGSTKNIPTSTLWQWVSGPILQSNIYAGEAFDARWRFANNKLKPCIVAPVFPPRIIPQTMPAEQRITEIKTAMITNPGKNIYLFDFGQNLTGWVKLKIKGEPGQHLTIRFAEAADSTGNADFTSTGFFATRVVQSDEYICNGHGTEIWEPKFTYHGFRYAEVTGLSKKPGRDLLTAIVVHNALKPAGRFECSNAQINRLHEMNLWTIKAGMHGLPVDCPHRERCGWTGDANLLAPSLMANFDGEAFFKKYVGDMISSGRKTERELAFGSDFFDRRITTKPAGIPTMIAPGRRTSGIASPEWGTAIVQIPYQVYRYYGDTTILNTAYQNMQIWVKYVADTCGFPIVKHGLGDWCPPGGNTRRECPISLSSTAFYYHDLMVMSKIARILGRTGDATNYQNSAALVRTAFNNLWFNQNSYGSQTANTLALAFGLCNEPDRAAVAAGIATDINQHGFITTGIFGLAQILNVLSENGEAANAFWVANKKGYNSFEYMWQHYGATTMWEVLPVDDYYDNPAKNDGKRSLNHPMNATTETWMHECIAGLKPLEPAYRRLTIKPLLTNFISRASLSYRSPFGLIETGYKKTTESYSGKVTIPGGCTAELWIPAKSSQKLILNGREYKNATNTNDITGTWKKLTVNSGTYHIKLK